jgi:hypothetical protein
VILSLKIFSIKNLTKGAKVIYVSNVGNQTKDTKWGLVEIVGIADFSAYTALRLTFCSYPKGGIFTSKLHSEN